jgi:HlyD family secretion protein
MKKNMICRLLKGILVLCQASLLLAACRDNKNENDASGTFEATETIVPAEADGIIMALSISEGQVLDSGQQIGYIDTVPLFLKKKQLESQIRAMGYKLPDIAARTAPFEQQAAVTQSRLDYLNGEKKRTEKLVQADAATPKQLDDINAQIREAQQQIKAIAKQGSAQASALGTQRSGLSADIQPLNVQIRQINDQLQKSRIVNPLKGTVLTKFAEAKEMAAVGKPLYTIADLSTLVLRAYVTGDQFTTLRVGQQVKVLRDGAVDSAKIYSGKIEWISDKAEFTPKTIQTKEERANLVYAIKVRVVNDGALKIGMYGEVKFQ